MRAHRFTPPRLGRVYPGTARYLGNAPKHWGWKCGTCGHIEAPYHYNRWDAWDQLYRHNLSSHRHGA